jgi:hypothetical protein
MATDNPTIDESYSVARNTSNMTVGGGMVPGQDQGFGNWAADVVLAAGMAAARGRGRLGTALLSLRDEWDRCEKPRKRTDAQIAARAAELAKNGKPDMHQATTEAIVWHARVMRERAMKLRGRSEVIGLLTEWAGRSGVDVDLIPLALFHWLSPICPVCDGRGRTLAPWPVMGHVCKHCNGSKTWPRPPGAGVIHEYISDALGKAKAGMVGRLRG